MVLNLNWDTDFFGFKVGVIKSNSTQTECLDFFNSSLSNEFDLLYFSSSVPIEFNHCPNFSIKLMDQKVTYLKELSENPLITENLFIKQIISNQSNDVLDYLAIESGVYSRFNLDENIPKNKFRELYQTWMLNSLNGTIASAVFGFEEHNLVKGMVTVGEKNGNADIGIISVDPSYRSKGIAKALISSAEVWAKKNSYKRLQVVTQQINKPACILYEKCGYELMKVDYVYHCWRNDFIENSLK